MDTQLAIAKLKKLPFYKSWQNNFVSKTQKNIVNYETSKLEPKDMDVFVYIPANSIIQVWANDKEFLAFRMENKFSDDYNFKLLADKTENNNRRLAIMYIAQFLKALSIDFIIDDAYTLYIIGEELEKLGTAENTALREFYNAFYIPKHFGGRKGSQETFS